MNMKQLWNILFVAILVFGIVMSSGVSEIKELYCCNTAFSSPTMKTRCITEPKSMRNCIVNDLEWKLEIGAGNCDLNYDRGDILTFQRFCANEFEKPCLFKEPVCQEGPDTLKMDILDGVECEKSKKCFQGKCIDHFRSTWDTGESQKIDNGGKTFCSAEQECCGKFGLKLCDAGSYRCVKRLDSGFRIEKCGNNKLHRYPYKVCRDGCGKLDTDQAAEIDCVYACDAGYYRSDGSKIEKCVKVAGTSTTLGYAEWQIEAEKCPFGSDRVTSDPNGINTKIQCLTGVCCKNNHEYTFVPGSVSCETGEKGDNCAPDRCNVNDKCQPAPVGNDNKLTIHFDKDDPNHRVTMILKDGIGAAPDGQTHDYTYIISFCTKESEEGCNNDANLMDAQVYCSKEQLGAPVTSWGHSGKLCVQEKVPMDKTEIMLNIPHKITDIKYLVAEVKRNNGDTLVAESKKYFLKLSAPATPTQCCMHVETKTVELEAAKSFPHEKKIEDKTIINAYISDGCEGAKNDKIFSGFTDLSKDFNKYTLVHSGLTHSYCHLIKGKTSPGAPDLEISTEGGKCCYWEIKKDQNQNQKLTQDINAGTWNPVVFGYVQAKECKRQNNEIKGADVLTKQYKAMAENIVRVSYGDPGVYMAELTEVDMAYCKDPDNTLKKHPIVPLTMHIKKGADDKTTGEAGIEKIMGLFEPDKELSGCLLLSKEGHDVKELTEVKTGGYSKETLYRQRAKLFTISPNTANADYKSIQFQFGGDECKVKVSQLRDFDCDGTPDIVDIPIPNYDPGGIDGNKETDAEKEAEFKGEALEKVKAKDGDDDKEFEDVSCYGCKCDFKAIIHKKDKTRTLIVNSDITKRAEKDTTDKECDMQKCYPILYNAFKTFTKIEGKDVDVKFENIAPKFSEMKEADKAQVKFSVEKNIMQTVLFHGRNSINEIKTEDGEDPPKDGDDPPKDGDDPPKDGDDPPKDVVPPELKGLPENLANEVKGMKEVNGYYVLPETAEKLGDSITKTGSLSTFSEAKCPTKPVENDGQYTTRFLQYHEDLFKFFTELHQHLHVVLAQLEDQCYDCMKEVKGFREKFSGCGSGLKLDSLTDLAALDGKDICSEVASNYCEEANAKTCTIANQKNSKLDEIAKCNLCIKMPCCLGAEYEAGKIHKDAGSALCGESNPLELGFITNDNVYSCKGTAEEIPKDKDLGLIKMEAFKDKAVVTNFPDGIKCDSLYKTYGCPAEAWAYDTIDDRTVTLKEYLLGINKEALGKSNVKIDELYHSPCLNADGSFKNGAVNIDAMNLKIKGFCYNGLFYEDVAEAPKTNNGACSAKNIFENEGKTFGSGICCSGLKYDKNLGSNCEDVLNNENAINKLQTDDGSCKKLASAATTATSEGICCSIPDGDAFKYHFVKGGKECGRVLVTLKDVKAPLGWKEEEANKKYICGKDGAVGEITIKDDDQSCKMTKKVVQVFTGYNDKKEIVVKLTIGDNNRPIEFKDGKLVDGDGVGKADVPSCTIKTAKSYHTLAYQPAVKYCQDSVLKLMDVCVVKGSKHWFKEGAGEKDKDMDPCSLAKKVRPLVNYLKSYIKVYEQDNGIRHWYKQNDKAKSSQEINKLMEATKFKDGDKEVTLKSYQSTFQNQLKTLVKNIESVNKELGDDITKLDEYDFFKEWKTGVVVEPGELQTRDERKTTVDKLIDWVSGKAKWKYSYECSVMADSGARFVTEEKYYEHKLGVTAAAESRMQCTLCQTDMSDAGKNNLIGRCGTQSEKKDAFKATSNPDGEDWKRAAQKAMDNLKKLKDRDLFNKNMACHDYTSKNPDPVKPDPNKTKETPGGSVCNDREDLACKNKNVGDKCGDGKGLCCGTGGCVIGAKSCTEGVIECGDKDGVPCTAGGQKGKCCGKKCIPGATYCCMGETCKNKEGKGEKCDNGFGICCRPLANTATANGLGVKVDAFAWINWCEHTTPGSVVRCDTTTKDNYYKNLDQAYQSCEGKSENQACGYGYNPYNGGQNNYNYRNTGTGDYRTNPAMRPGASPTVTPYNQNQNTYRTQNQYNQNYGYGGQGICCRSGNYNSNDYSNRGTNYYNYNKHYDTTRHYNNNNNNRLYCKTQTDSDGQIRCNSRNYNNNDKSEEEKCEDSCNNVNSEADCYNTCKKHKSNENCYDGCYKGDVNTKEKCKELCLKDDWHEDDPDLSDTKNCKGKSDGTDCDANVESGEMKYGGICCSEKCTSNYYQGDGDKKMCMPEDTIDCSEKADGTDCDGFIESNEMKYKGLCCNKKCVHDYNTGEDKKECPTDCQEQPRNSKCKIKDQDGLCCDNKCVITEEENCNNVKDCPECLDDDATCAEACKACVGVEEAHCHAQLGKCVCEKGSEWVAIEKSCSQTMEDNDAQVGEYLACCYGMVNEKYTGGSSSSGAVSITSGSSSFEEGAIVPITYQKTAEEDIWLCGTWLTVTSSSDSEVYSADYKVRGSAKCAKLTTQEQVKWKAEVKAGTYTITIKYCTETTANDLDCVKDKDGSSTGTVIIKGPNGTSSGNKDVCKKVNIGGSGITFDKCNGMESETGFCCSYPPFGISKPITHACLEDPAPVDVCENKADGDACTDSDNKPGMCCFNKCNIVVKSCDEIDPNTDCDKEEYEGKDCPYYADEGICCSGYCRPKATSCKENSTDLVLGCAEEHDGLACPNDDDGGLCCDGIEGNWICIDSNPNNGCRVTPPIEPQGGCTKEMIGEKCPKSAGLCCGDDSDAGVVCRPGATLCEGGSTDMGCTGQNDGVACPDDITNICCGGKCTDATTCMIPDQHAGCHESAIDNGASCPLDASGEGTCCDSYCIAMGESCSDDAKGGCENATDSEQCPDNPEGICCEGECVVDSLQCNPDQVQGCDTTTDGDICPNFAEHGLCCGKVCLPGATVCESVKNECQVLEDENVDCPYTKGTCCYNQYKKNMCVPDAIACDLNGRPDKPIKTEYLKCLDNCGKDGTWMCKALCEGHLDPRTCAYGCADHFKNNEDSAKTCTNICESVDIACEANCMDYLSTITSDEPKLSCMADKCSTDSKTGQCIVDCYNTETKSTDKRLCHKVCKSVGTNLDITVELLRNGKPITGENQAMYVGEEAQMKVYLTNPLNSFAYSGKLNLKFRKACDCPDDDPDDGIETQCETACKEGAFEDITSFDVSLVTPGENKKTFLTSTFVISEENADTVIQPYVEALDHDGALVEEVYGFETKVFKMGKLGIVDADFYVVSGEEGEETLEPSNSANPTQVVRGSVSIESRLFPITVDVYMVNPSGVELDDTRNTYDFTDVGTIDLYTKDLTLTGEMMDTVIRLQVEIKDENGDVLVRKQLLEMGGGTDVCEGELLEEWCETEEGKFKFAYPTGFLAVETPTIQIESAIFEDADGLVLTQVSGSEQVRAHLTLLSLSKLDLLGTVWLEVIDEEGTVVNDPQMTAVSDLENGWDVTSNFFLTGSGSTYTMKLSVKDDLNSFDWSVEPLYNGIVDIIQFPTAQLVALGEDDIVDGQYCPISNYRVEVGECNVAVSCPLCQCGCGPVLNPQACTLLPNDCSCQCTIEFL